MTPAKTLTVNANSWIKCDPRTVRLGPAFNAYTAVGEPYLERLIDRHLVIEVRSNRMPDGGLVITFTEIGVNLFGDWLRGVTDPTARGRTPGN